jgi:hypothetical protein
VTVAPALSTLFASTTPEDELAELLGIAAAVGLPTTAWLEGEPTLTILEIVSQRLSQLTQSGAPIHAGGLLDYTSGDWLTLLAKDFYNEDRIEATFASTGVTLTNSSGAGAQTYEIGANDLTFENSTSGKTYKNSDPVSGTVTLAPGRSITLGVVADEAGTGSNAGPGQIDTLVSTLIGVTVSNATAAIAFDTETDDSLKARCRLKVPAISKTAAAPAGKYTYIAVTPAENGGANVNRADVRGDNTDGTVTVVCAGPSGAVSGTDTTLVETALVKTTIGPVETLSVISATNNPQTIVADLWVYSDANMDAPTIQAAAQAKLALLFAVSPIGGWKKTGDTSGRVWRRLLESVIRSVTNRSFEVEVSSPASDVALGVNDVPVISGTPTINVHFETPPATGGTI